MNYYGGHNMANSWRTVRNNTIQIAEEIPADKYDFRASEDTMTVAELLSHMATNTLWGARVHFAEKKSAIAMQEFGEFQAAARDASSKLTTKDLIVAALKENGEELARGLEGISDAALAEVVTLPGGDKTRFEMLLGLKEHEMHHRGQLMVVERLLGIVPHMTRMRLERMAKMAEMAAAATATTAH
ncbi:MAG: DinB family protein [Gemmatimonadaceae bacterium]